VSAAWERLQIQLRVRETARVPAGLLGSVVGSVVPVVPVVPVLDARHGGSPGLGHGSVPREGRQAPAAATQLEGRLKSWESRLVSRRVPGFLAS
jgi:hypothetical protein